MFERFTKADDARTHHATPSTGLGLAISQKLVKLMGGQLELQSEVGRGSCFSFTIEAESADAAAVDSDQQEAAAEAQFDGQPVL